jgi:hypothetical protein
MAEKKWQPPLEDVIMFNIDGAFSERTMKRGWGTIARDFVWGHCLCCSGFPECKALHQAVHLADQMGIGRVIFATDCMTLNSEASDEMDLSPLGIKFRQIKFLLNFNYVETNIVHCLRICTKPAHALVSLGAGAVYMPLAA